MELIFPSEKKKEPPLPLPLHYNFLQIKPLVVITIIKSLLFYKIYFSHKKLSNNNQLVVNLYIKFIQNILSLTSHKNEKLRQLHC